MIQACSLPPTSTHASTLMSQTSDLFLGIEIGGTKIQLVTTDESMNEIVGSSFKVGAHKEAAYIQAQLSTKIREMISSNTVKAVGVGFGGPVNHSTGQIYKSFQITGWDNFNLVEWIFNMVDQPVFLENDCNVAALAESTLGAGQSYSRVFYITLGSGVGGGFIVDGSIYHGKGPSELEIGHLALDKQGRTLESSCSGWALNNKLLQYIRKAPNSMLAQLVKKRGTDETKCMMEAIQAGDENLETIWDDTIDDLSHGLSHVIHLLNPDIIIIGGGLSMIGKKLLDDIDAKLPNYLMPTLKNNLPTIKLSALKEKSVPYGAIQLAMSKSAAFNQKEH